MAVCLGTANNNVCQYHIISIAMGGGPGGGARVYLAHAASNELHAQDQDYSFPAVCDRDGSLKVLEEGGKGVFP